MTCPIAKSIKIIGIEKIKPYPLELILFIKQVFIGLLPILVKIEKIATIREIIKLINIYINISLIGFINPTIGLKLIFLK
jgi:hypothetical protein